MPLFAVLALAQQPTPVLGGVRVVPSLAGQSTKRVTLRFDDAPLKDVLARLKKEKVDYVVDAGAFRDRKLSLSMTDVPLGEALDVIAEALGAHWERAGSVRVLKPGLGTRLNLYQEGFRSLTAPAMPKWDDKALKGFELSKEAQEQAAKALAEAGKSLQGQSFEYRKLFEPKMDMRGFAWPKEGYTYRSLSPKEAEEFRKAMERIRGDAKVYRMDPKALEELRKNRVEYRFDDETRKVLERSRLRGEGLRGPISEETRKALEKARGSLNLSKKGFDDLLKSLTPEQKELQKKQGYLKVSDLTEAQRGFIGIKGDGKTEVTIVRDGETIKIKGE